MLRTIAAFLGAASTAIGLVFLLTLVVWEIGPAGANSPLRAAAHFALFGSIVISAIAVFVGAPVYFLLIKPGIIGRPGTLLVASSVGFFLPLLMREFGGEPATLLGEAFSGAFIALSSACAFVRIAKL